MYIYTLETHNKKKLLNGYSIENLFLEVKWRLRIYVENLHETTVKKLTDNSQNFDTYISDKRE